MHQADNRSIRLTYKSCDAVLLSERRLSVPEVSSPIIFFGFTLKLPERLDLRSFPAGIKVDIVQAG